MYTDTPRTNVAELRRLLPSHTRTTAEREGCYAVEIRDPSSSLSEMDQNQIYKMLVPLTSGAFGADMEAYWHGRRKQGYFARLTSFSLIIDRADNVVGWSGYSEMEFDGKGHIYLDSSGIIPELQSLGVLGSFVKSQVSSYMRDFSAATELFISCRTESPIVYKVFRTLLGAGNLWPNSATDPTPEIRRQAVLLADWLGHPEKLNADTLMVKGAYSDLAALYGELPSTGEHSLDVLFRENLGPLDAYLLIGRRQIAHHGRPA